MTELNGVLISLAIIAGAIAAALLLHAILKSAIMHRHSRKPFAIKGVPLRLEYLSRPLQSAIPAAFLLIALPFVRFEPQVVSIINHVAQVWLLCSFAYLGIAALAMTREMVLSQYQIDASDNLKARQMYTQIRVFERVLIFLILLLSLASVLMTFEKVREIGVSMLASAGLIGLVVGFAAQKSLATLLAGIQIAITQPIRIDDVVIVEGEWGRIEEITLTYVVIRIWDERRLIVPITYFIEKPFQNWTRISAELLGTVFVYADYTISIEDLRSELKRILESSPLWDKRVCGLQVTDATDRTIELRALMSAADSSNAWDLRCLVREKLIEFIRNNHPEELPRVRVEMDRKNRLPRKNEPRDENLVTHYS